MITIKYGGGDGGGRNKCKETSRTYFKKLLLINPVPEGVVPLSCPNHDKSGLLKGTCIFSEHSFEVNIVMFS